MSKDFDDDFVKYFLEGENERRKERANELNKKYGIKKLEREIKFGSTSVSQTMIVPTQTFKNRFKRVDLALPMSYADVRNYLMLYPVSQNKQYTVDLAFDIGIRQVRSRSKGTLFIKNRAELSISDTRGWDSDEDGNSDLEKVYAIYITEF